MITPASYLLLSLLRAEGSANDVLDRIDARGLIVSFQRLTGRDAASEVA